MERDFEKDKGILLFKEITASYLDHQFMSALLVWEKVNICEAVLYTVNGYVNSRNSLQYSHTHCIPLQYSCLPITAGSSN